MNDSRRAIGVASLAILVAAALMCSGANAAVAAQSTALKLRATVLGSGTPAAMLTIDLFRWSTEEERGPMITALSAPPPPPPAAEPPAGRAAGRGGRGGRAAGPPPTPIERLSAAIKAAPTVGFIWGEGPTGYSIKYAWHVAVPEGERIVLITDRHLGANERWGGVVAKTPASQPDAAGSAANAEFTVIEMRLGPKGAGEAKASLSAPVVVDAAAKTLALDGYAAAPALLKVTR